MAGPLIIDEEHEASAQMISNVLEKLNGLFIQYINELNNLSSNDVVRGKAGNALKAYAQQAEKIQAALSEIASSHQQACQRFLSSVDTADQVHL